MKISLNMVLTLITGKWLMNREEFENYFDVVGFLLEEKLDECEKRRISNSQYSFYSEEKTKLIASYLLEKYPAFQEICDKLIEADFDNTFALLERYNEIFPTEYIIEPIPLEYEPKTENVKVKK